MTPQTAQPEPSARPTLAGLRLLALSLLTGLLTGVVAVAFRAAVHALEDGSDALQHAAGPAAWLLRFVGPALAGLAAGLLLYRVLRVHAGHGVPAVIEATVRDKPLADWRMAAKAGTSSLVIGGGGSAGPEGPIVEIGAVGGSYLWKWFRLGQEELRILMGGGAAAGIAAVFSAPLGGVLFVLEVILRDYRLRTIAPIMLASVAGSSVAQYAYGTAPTLTLARPEQIGASVYLLCLAVGLAAGLLSAGFIRISETIGQRMAAWKEPAWRKPLLGGLCVGVLAAMVGPVGGAGYALIEQLAHEPLLWTTVLALLAAKLLATALTLGSGAPGGAFAPSLVLGACLGALCCRYPLGTPADLPAAVLLGLCGMIAGTFQAPLTAILISFKIGHHHSDMLVPLLATAAISSWLAGHAVSGNYYDWALLRRGLRLDTARQFKLLLEGRSVGEVMQTGSESLTPEQTLGQILDLVSRSRQDLYPVLDQDRQILGVVHIDLIRQTIRSGDLEHGLIVQDLLESPPPFVTPQTGLDEAWNLFQSIATDELLVVESLSDGRPPRVVGWLTRGAITSLR